MCVPVRSESLVFSRVGEEEEGETSKTESRGGGRPRDRHSGTTWALVRKDSRHLITCTSPP